VLAPATAAAHWEPASVLPKRERSAPFVRVSPYVLQSGDTVSSVARDHGLAVETVLSYNKIPSPRLIRAGQQLRLPDRDGILVTLDKPTSVRDVSATYKVFPTLILLANSKPENALVLEGDVFLPGVRMNPTDVRRMLGVYFGWPTKGGRISSYFGKRNDPFTGIQSSHSGVDIANYHGAPVYAAAPGVVTSTGYSSVLGNYVSINMGEGYTTVYGHLSVIQTKAGRRVFAGQQIGKVGSTGYSTGPHLHFSAYKNNRLLDPMRLFE